MACSLAVQTDICHTTNVVGHMQTHTALGSSASSNTLDHGATVVAAASAKLWQQLVLHAVTLHNQSTWHINYGFCIAQPPSHQCTTYSFCVAAVPSPKLLRNHSVSDNLTNITASAAAVAEAGLPEVFQATCRYDVQLELNYCSISNAFIGGMLYSWKHLGSLVIYQASP